MHGYKEVKERREQPGGWFELYMVMEGAPSSCFITFILTHPPPTNGVVVFGITAYMTGKQSASTTHIWN